MAVANVVMMQVIFMCLNVPLRASQAWNLFKYEKQYHYNSVRLSCERHRYERLSTAGKLCSETRKVA